MDARRRVAAASAGKLPISWRLEQLGGLKMRIVPALFSSVIVCGLLAIRMATAADGLTDTRGIKTGKMRTPQ